MNFEMSDIVVVLAAVIAAIVNIILAICNNNVNRKSNKEKIDADLKAKARIDWIDKVREHTAELISIYYKILKTTNKGELLDRMQEARKHSDILSLYFGTDRDKKKQFDIEILSKREDNKDKNEMIVRYIDLLFDKIREYYNDVINDKRAELERNKQRAEEDVEKYPIGEEYIADLVMDDGQIMPITDSVPDPELKGKAIEASIKLHEYKESITEIHKMLTELRDYMRLYLKIEWDIAKEGK